MSLRYGDKTRVGEASSKAGRNDPTILNVYEQEFLAPGTWTWPGKCNFVEVLVVGGGGGGKTMAPPFTAPQLNVAGGGGVGVFSVPVNAPVPVTVGAGGPSPTYPNPGPLSVGGNGGTSAFGSLTPPIPSDVAQVGGGEGVEASTPIPTAIRGGAETSRNYAFGGKFGTAGIRQAGPTNRRWGGGGGEQGSFAVWPDAFAVGFGTYGYGAGGHDYNAIYQGATRAGVPSEYVSPFLGVNRIGTAGGANTGAAGGTGHYPPAAPYPAPLMSGKAGGSGIVIVRWYE